MQCPLHASHVDSIPVRLDYKGRRMNVAQFCKHIAWDVYTMLHVSVLPFSDCNCLTTY